MIWLWDFGDSYISSTNNHILQQVIRNQNLIHLQQCKDCLLSTLICLKLAIGALNWSMGMVGAGANSFNFSLSIELMLDKLDVFQILKLVGLYFGIFRLADFRAT